MRLFCGKGDKAQKISAQRTLRLASIKSELFNVVIIFHLCCIFFRVLQNSSTLLWLPTIAQNLMIASELLNFYSICCCYNLKNGFFRFAFFTRQSIERIGLKCEIAYGDKSMLLGFRDLAFANFITFDGRFEHSFINHFHDLFQWRGKKRELCASEKTYFLLNSYLIQTVNVSAHPLSDLL